MKSRRYKSFLRKCSVRPTPLKASELEGKQWVKVKGCYNLIESEELPKKWGMG